MECSQSAAWTTNRSLPLEFRVKAFPRRPTQSGSTIPRAAHLDDGVIGSHQCLHVAPGKCSDICQHATKPFWFCPTCLPSTTSIPAPTQHTIAMTNYTNCDWLVRLPRASVVTQQTDGRMRTIYCTITVLSECRDQIQDPAVAGILALHVDEWDIRLMFYG